MEACKNASVAGRDRLKKQVIVSLAAFVFFTTNAQSQNVRIEVLNDVTTPASIGHLDGTWCRSIDKIVHLKISVDWPREQMTVETSDFHRFIFWTKDAEYLFPQGSYDWERGSYFVNNYFIARSGGIHQGVVSQAFEKVDDTKVLLNPFVREISVKKNGCK